MPEAFKLPLERRCAVVTGGARGLGERVADELGALGASVGVLDVDGEAAERCAEQLRARGRNALAVRCDVADRAIVAEAFDEVARRLGQPGVLVNNAAVLSTAPFLELSRAEWERVLAVDLTGVFNCCRAAVPGMVESGFGRIVNVASVAGARGGGLLGTAAYAAAKAGVLGFTCALGRELDGTGVTVHAVVPGALETAMTRALEEDAELRGRALAAIPLGRLGTVEEVADAVASLASGLAPLPTGELLAVDGGVLMA